MEHAFFSFHDRKGASPLSHGSPHFGANNDFNLARLDRIIDPLVDLLLGLEGLSEPCMEISNLGDIFSFEPHIVAYSQ